MIEWKRTKENETKTKWKWSERQIKDDVKLERNERKLNPYMKPRHEVKTGK